MYYTINDILRIYNRNKNKFRIQNKDFTFYDKIFQELQYLVKMINKCEKSKSEENKNLLIKYYREFDEFQIKYPENFSIINYTR